MRARGGPSCGGVGAGDDLVLFWVCPGNAGHEYGSIERQGLRELVVEQGGAPTVVDNPRLLRPERR